jgi:excisionase family DNA binding protein
VADEHGRKKLVDDGLVRIAEAMEFLSLSRAKLYEMMDSGELSYVKFGRARRIPRQALVELAARNLRGERS